MALRVQMWSQLSSFADPKLSGALAFAVLGPTVFAFSALSFASQKLKPSINSSYITLQPMLVSVVSLVLFGTTLSSQEIGAGGIVLAGLYLSIIGNPQVDRAWVEYVQDLPTNVPQTIASVADASVEAATTVGDAVADLGSDVRDYVQDLPTNVPQTIASVADASVEAATTVSGAVVDLGSDVREKIDNALSNHETAEQAFERRMDEALESIDTTDSKSREKERVR